MLILVRHGRTEANESVSPQTGRLPMKFAVQSYDRTHEKSGAEPQGCFFISAERHESIEQALQS